METQDHIWVNFLKALSNIFYLFFNNMLHLSVTGQTEFFTKILDKLEPFFKIKISIFNVFLLNKKSTYIGIEKV